MADSLAIIIDQWKWKHDASHQLPRELLDDALARRIIAFVEINAIHTAVLASYQCSAELYSNTVWYQNRLAVIDPIYSTQQFESRIADDYTAFLDQEQCTADVLLNYANPAVFQVAMRDDRELAQYLNLHPEIQDIYIVGSAWEQCVQNRLLGYQNVYEKFCQNSDRRLLTNLDCVVTQVSGPPNLDADINWFCLHDQVYQYRPA